MMEELLKAVSLPPLPLLPSISGKDLILWNAESAEGIADQADDDPLSPQMFAFYFPPRLSFCWPNSYCCMQNACVIKQWVGELITSYCRVIGGGCL